MIWDEEIRIYQLDTLLYIRLSDIYSQEILFNFTFEKLHSTNKKLKAEFWRTLEINQLEIYVGQFYITFLISDYSLYTIHY